MSEIYQPFQESLARQPQDLRDVFCAVNQSDGKIDDCFLDTILGIPRLRHLGKEFINETDFPQPDITFMDFIYEGTAYRLIRDILHKIKPTEQDVVYDIGSGYGRFALYGALTTDAQFKGIEFVTSRYDKATEIKKRFVIGNAAFINENVLDVDMSDGTIFYMFNPFYPRGNSTQYAVENELRKIADAKPITVVTYAMTNEFKFPYLFEDRFQFAGNVRSSRSPINIFRSTPPGFSDGSK